MSLYRLPGESNTSLQTRIQNIGKYPENSGRQGLVNAISSALGYNQYNILTRRIYILSHLPYRTSTFTVTVDGVLATSIDGDAYSGESTGYIVWKDEEQEYIPILEFRNPPGFSRDVTTRKHDGPLVEVTYTYQDGDRIRVHTDKCNPYDQEDESYMGWSPDVEGSVGVRSLADTEWINASVNGWKNADGTATAKLKAIWHEVDSAMPSTWGA